MTGGLLISIFIGLLVFGKLCLTKLEKIERSIVLIQENQIPRLMQDSETLVRIHQSGGDRLGNHP